MKKYYVVYLMSSQSYLFGNSSCDNYEVATQFETEEAAHKRIIELKITAYYTVIPIYYN